MSRRLVALALCFAAAAVALHPVADPDTFWHLTLGRAVVAAHARTLAEPVAFAAFAPAVTAAEWLWEVLAYGVFRLGGCALLSWLLAVLAALAALTTWRLANTARAAFNGGFAAPLLTTALALLTIGSRMVLRPQSAYLVLLPLFVALALPFAATEKPRLKLSLVLVAIVVVWAQLHGSFILAPLVFVTATLNRSLLSNAKARRAWLLTLLAIALACLTGAHGPGIIVYVLEHAGGDAVRHIADMRAPAWAELDPISPYALGLWLLAALAIVGLVAARKIWWTGLALMLLGLLLLATAIRFVDAAAILTLPLAVRGADALASIVPPWRAWKWLATATAAALLLWLALLARGWWGPVRGGIDEARVPLTAAAWLYQAPVSNVLSTYEADAPLGFLLAGHDRVFVDGRTPLYFDATDYAIAREVWQDKRALQTALARYDVAAVVAPRDSELCAWMAARWQPVTVEANYTTFVATPNQPLAHLEACGDDVLPRRACDDYAGTRAELDRMRALYDSPLWPILAVDLAARCNQPLPMLPSQNQSWAFDKAWRRAAARVALIESRPKDALELVQPLVDAGDLQALSIVRPAFNALPLELVRARLEAAVRALDDAAPPELRADLAMACSAVGDVECVRFHGLRAAARGAANARAPLEWLTAHAPSPRVQEDARKWLETLPR